jgi:DNA-binding ferritin-like protein
MTFKEYQKLHDAIESMFTSIAENKNDVAEHVLEVDRLSREMISEVPPMLRHYLERRSYQKALDFINGEDESEKAKC